MSFFSSAKAKLAASKLAEEQLYAQAAEEVASGQIRQGLWAKALAESDGDETAAKGRYLKLRVEIMRAQAEVTDYVRKQAAKADSGKSPQSEGPPRRSARRPPTTRSHYRPAAYLRSLGFSVTGGPDDYKVVDELGVAEWFTEERLLSFAKKNGWEG